jgi:hypothetical protein
MFAKTTSKDLSLAVAVTIAGGVAMALALRQRWNPSDLSPGVEGAITTTVTGFLMTLLHKVDYPRTIAINAPLVAILYAACLLGGSHAVGLGMAGLQCVIMGFVGLALAFREPRPAPAPAPKPARRTSATSRPAHSQA